MLKVSVVIILAITAVYSTARKPPCAYWCYSFCKTVSEPVYFCCSYDPTGRTYMIREECPNAPAIPTVAMKAYEDSTTNSAATMHQGVQPEVTSYSRKEPMEMVETVYQNGHNPGAVPYERMIAQTGRDTWDIRRVSSKASKLTSSSLPYCQYTKLPTERNCKTEMKYKTKCLTSEDCASTERCCIDMCKTQQPVCELFR